MSAFKNQFCICSTCVPDGYKNGRTLISVGIEPNSNASSLELDEFITNVEHTLIFYVKEYEKLIATDKGSQFSQQWLQYRIDYFGKLFSKYSNPTSNI